LLGGWTSPVKPILVNGSDETPRVPHRHFEQAGEVNGVVGFARIPIHWRILANPTITLAVFPSELASIACCSLIVQDNIELDMNSIDQKRICIIGLGLTQVQNH
jgi:hypothetical protein